MKTALKAIVVLGLSLRRSDLFAITVKAMQPCVELAEGYAATGVERKGVPDFQTAQTTRASLFASATAAVLCPRRCARASAQVLSRSGVAVRRAPSSTERAPWISRVLR